MGKICQFTEEEIKMSSEQMKIWPNPSYLGTLRSKRADQIFHKVVVNLKGNRINTLKVV